MKTICALFVAFTIASFPPSDVKLEYVFKAGDTYVVEQSGKQEMKQSIMGMDQNFNNFFTASYTMQVDQLTSTGAKIKFEYTKLKNEMKSTMINTVMDSEGDAASTENKIFKALVNKPFFMFINKKGEIEKLEGLDNLWSGFPTSGIDENTQKMVKQNLQQMFGEDVVKATMQQMFVTYTDKKMKTGDTWKVNTAVPFGFPIRIEDTYKFENASGSEASFTSDGTAISDKDKVVEVQGGLKAKADLAGRQAKKSTVDTKTGWPKKVDVLSEMKGNMTLLAGGMIPEDMNIPLEVVTETTFLISKK